MMDEVETIRRILFAMQKDIARIAEALDRMAALGSVEHPQTARPAIVTGKIPSIVGADENGDGGVEV